MRQLTTILSTLVFALVLSAAIKAQQVDITILHTTDLHGHIFSQYHEERDVFGGLDRIATLVKQERQNNPNTLLLDCGDTIQGNSMGFLFKGRHIVQAMNYLRYDAMVIGNHEFNFGQDVLATRIWESSFPWLAANVRLEKTVGADTFLPAPAYIIREIDGVKIGIVGLTVTDVPNWEQPEYIEGLHFVDIVETAREYADTLHPDVDVLIALAHTGVEPRTPWRSGYDPGAAGEAIANACPEYDVILCGHRHVPVESRIINGVLLTAANFWGSHLGKVSLTVQPDENGRMTLVSKKAELIPITPDITPDPGVMAVAEPFRNQWEEWARTELGTLADTFDLTPAQVQPTAAIDLIHQALKWATGADITFHVAFNNSVVLPPGVVTNQDIFDIYYYDNALWVLTLTGRQIKDALEAGAGMHDSWRFLTAGYLEYSIDISRPSGERLLWVRYQGEPLADDAVLTAAINHYNGVGGGGLRSFGDALEVQRTGKWVREVIADYIREHSPVTMEDKQWWTIQGYTSNEPVADQETVITTADY